LLCYRVDSVVLPLCRPQLLNSAELPTTCQPVMKIDSLRRPATHYSVKRSFVPLSFKEELERIRLITAWDEPTG